MCKYLPVQHVRARKIIQLAVLTTFALISLSGGCKCNVGTGQSSMPDKRLVSVVIESTNYDATTNKTTIVAKIINLNHVRLSMVDFTLKGFDSSDNEVLNEWIQDGGIPASGEKEVKITKPGKIDAKSFKCEINAVFG